MKKILFLMLAFVLSMAVQVKADDIPFRQQRREMFSICPTDPQTVVFLGNSITNFGVWPEVFANEGYKVVNRGISGNLSPEVMQHIRLIADGQPKAIYLMIGINDFGTPDIIVPSIRKTIQIVREVSPNTDIYVQSILPCAYNQRQTTPTTQNPLIKAMIESDFADDSKVHYADIFDALSTDGSTPKSGVLDDNLHPNVNGYRDWTKKLHAGGYIDVAPKYSDEAWSDAGNVHYYDNRILGQYNKLPLSADDILIMGDQTVQGGEWAELMQNQNVKNRGIGIGTGQLTTYVAKFKIEIPYILHGSVMPSKIAVQVGQGDLILNGTEAATVWTTYEQCIDLIHEKAPSAQIYLNTVIPVVSGDGKSANNAKVTAFNDMIRSYAATKDYCTLVDIADVVDDAEGYLAAEFEGANSKQSKVPNARAYLEWAKLLSQTMGLSTTPRATLTAKQYELLLKIDDTYARAYAQNVGTALGNITQSGIDAVLETVATSKTYLSSTDDTAIDAQISGLTSALSSMSNDLVLTPQTQDAQGRPQYYTFRSQRNSRYVTAQSGNANVQGIAAIENGSYWRFVERTQDEDYDLVNYATGEYVSADGVNSGQPIKLVSSSPSKGWHISKSRTDGYLYILGTGIQFNQANNNNNVLTWVDQNPNGDAGCNYTIEAIDFSMLPNLPEEELDTKSIVVGNTQSGSLAMTDAQGHTQYYVMKNMNRGYYVAENNGNVEGKTANPSNTLMAGNTYVVSLEEMSTTEGTTTVKVRFYGSGKFLTFPATNNTALTTSQQGTTLTLQASAQGTNGWYLSDASSGTTLYLNGKPSQPVTWTAAEANSTYYFYPISFVDSEELTYELTDNAGNVYTYKGIGSAGNTLPTLTGATLGEGQWEGSKYSASITFPFSVSKQGGTSNYVGISAFSGTSFYYYAKGNGICVKKNNQATDYTYAWCIYPSMDDTGKFTFTIKNVETDTYIYSTSSANSHNAGVVTLAAEGTPMTFTNNGFLLPTNKYLSVNSSSPTTEQTVGTWDSHGGVQLSFTNLDLEPKEEPQPIGGTVTYALQLDHANLGNLMPQPHSVNLTGTDLTLSGAIHIIYNRELSEDESYLQNVMTRFLTETGCTAGEGINLQVNFVSAITGTEDYTVAKFDNEAYAIKIDGNTITVSAIKPIGVVRAMQTLTMMAKEDSSLPGCEIVDWPAFKVRGLMHDIGRSYISVDELKREIDLLSRFKENVFLWHLTDKHGFRFQSIECPEVNRTYTATRTSSARAHEYYTQEECREVSEYAHERGMTIIPEIDMPGHSAQFQPSTGYTMTSAEGKAILKKVLQEVVNTFQHSPYIHIGGDETADATREYMNEMGAYVRSLGRKVVLWNRYSRPAVLVTPSNMEVDMTTNWATNGTLVSGVPNIDMRYNYINHFDMYGDLAGIYRSKIFNVTKGNPDVAGSITGIWNDRLIPEEELIVKENNLYANALATAERAWKGGGLHYIDEDAGGAYLPNSGSEYDEFKDWETRFLYHKNTTLSEVKSLIPYVKQTNVRWNITKAYQNGGDKNKVFAPEKAETLVPEAGDITATGAGIWLNHIWAGTVAGILGKAGQPTGQTRYAWTYVYSPKAQTLGAQVETYNYSRSQMGAAPANGTWDNRGSEIWVNDTKLLPNVERWTTAGSDEETNLGNINFTARPLMQVQLNEGWNKVFLKLPNTADNIGNYGGKWQFTFVFTDPEGNDAAADLIYSPTKCINEDAELLATVIQEVRTYIANTCSSKVGYYSSELAESIADLAEEMYATLGDATKTTEDRNAQKTALRSALAELKAAVANAGADGIIRPQTSSTYTLKADRGSKYAQSNGEGAGMSGNTTATPQAMWTFTQRADGTYDIQNFADSTYLTPYPEYNKTLVSSSEKPANGWTLTPSATLGYFLLTTTLGSQKNELHQTNSTAVYNWGWDGADPRDADGCRYLIEEVTDDMLPRRVSVAYNVTGATTFADNNYRLGELNITSGSTTVAIPSVTDGGNTFSYLVNPGRPITITEKQRYHGWNTPTIVRSEADTLQFTVTYTPNLKEESQYLWYTTKDNHPYRIPAIAKMSNGKLLAVMDYRTCGDDIGMGEVDLVGRIGTPDGKSWTEEFTIADGDGNATTYPYFGCGYGDAAVVADRESGKVVIMCVSGKVRYTNANATTHPCVARIVSDDFGAHWTIEDVTSQFLGTSSSLLPGSYALFFGSGRIVQSKLVKAEGSDCYRLYASIVSRGSNANGNYVVYSDDFGAHWTILGTDANYTSCAPNGNEPKVEELPNGDIMLSSRKGGGRYFNVFHFNDFANNKTQGSWGSQTNSTGITAADCNGEIIIMDAYNTYDGSKTKVLLQSVPCNSSRRDVGIYYKEIDENTQYTASTIATGWTKGMAVSNLESAYSTMVEQEDGRLAFLFEEAPTWNNTFGYAEVYRPISLYEATAGAFQTEEVTEPTKDAHLKYFNTEEELAKGHLSWVGIRNVRNNNYTCYVANDKATVVGSHNTVNDEEAELFAFVGTPESFYIYSKTYGTAEGKALGYANGNEDTSVQPGTPSTFRLINHSSSVGTFLIAPTSNEAQSWNMHGGAGNPIKFYSGTDGGSNWRLDLTSLYGDVNRDGCTNLDDVAALSHILLQGLTPSVLVEGVPAGECYNFRSADTNGDGIITLSDLTELIVHLNEKYGNE